MHCRPCFLYQSLGGTMPSLWVHPVILGAPQKRFSHVHHLPSPCQDDAMSSSRLEPSVSPPKSRDTPSFLLPPSLSLLWRHPLKSSQPACRVRLLSQPQGAQSRSCKLHGPLWDCIVSPEIHVVKPLVSSVMVFGGKALGNYVLVKS